MSEFNLPAHEYRDHHALVPNGKNLWENNGWFVMGTAPPGGQRETDVVLWLSPYRLMGSPGGPFTISDIAIDQTLLIAVDYPPSERDRMHDNPFTSVGWDPVDFLPPDSLQVSDEGTAVVWRVGHRAYAASPPTWTIQGQHAGVDLDLKMEALCPAFWFTNSADDVLVTGDRWIYVQTRVEGTVAFANQRLALRGFASHERHTRIGTRYDPITLYAGAGVYWHNICSEDFQMMAIARPSLGVAYGKVILADRVLNFDGPSAVRIDELDHWVDPQSGFTIPYRWRVRMESSEGTLESEATAFARAYYAWHHLTHGSTLLYFWAARCDAHLTLANGQRYYAEHVPYGVHSNRVIQQRVVMV